MSEYRQTPESFFWEVKFTTALPNAIGPYSKMGHSHLVAAISEDAALAAVEADIRAHGISPISPLVARRADQIPFEELPLSPDEVYAIEQAKRNVAIVKPSFWSGFWQLLVGWFRSLFK